MIINSERSWTFKYVRERSENSSFVRLQLYINESLNRKLSKYLHSQWLCAEKNDVLQKGLNILNKKLKI